MATPTVLNVTGRDAVLRRLNTEVRKIKGRTKAGMWKAVLVVDRRAAELTPVATGNLIDSRERNVFLRGDAVVGYIGYTATYAPYVHEMVRAHFRKPGAQAKFLETALKEKAAEVLGILAAEVRKP
jgi:hypothetical protein